MPWHDDHVIAFRRVSMVIAYLLALAHAVRADARRSTQPTKGLAP